MFTSRNLRHTLLIAICFLFVSPNLFAQIDTTDCCIDIRGNVDGDQNDQIDISDLVAFVQYAFLNQETIPCLDEADINGSGSIDISDIVALVSFMFAGGESPVFCDLDLPLLIDNKVLITMEEVINGNSKELHFNYRSQSMFPSACIIIETQFIDISNYFYISFDTTLSGEPCLAIPAYIYGSDNLGELANSTYSLTLNNGVPYAVELKVTNGYYQITGTDERQFIITNPILYKTP